MSGLEVLNVFSTNPRYRWVKDLSDCVCLVEDEITSLVCVAKYLSKSASNVLLHQFRVEIDVLSTLSCPYVPTLVDVLENQDYIIMIETYIPGISLDVWIKDAGIVKKYRLLKDIILILGSVHDSNYLYIDLKPSNVIVYEDHAYLIDFNACILNGCSKAIMASSSNCAPELLTLEKKGVYCDVYAFGCLVQFVLNKKIHCFLCSKKYRIHTFQHVLKILWLHIFGYKLVIILFCCLSVLYMVACFQERSVFDRYYYGQDVRLFQEAYVSSEDALYRWIESDWIIDEVYRDEESVVFLFKEALKTENTNLIRYIYEHIDPLIIENHEDLLALVLLSLDFDADQVNLCIKSVIDSGFSCKQKLMIVDQCLVGCLENKLVMDLGVVQAWINDLSIGQIESNFESFNDLGVHYLEYLLLLKKEEGLSFDVPDVFIENIDSSSWDDLYGLWRALE